MSNRPEATHAAPASASGALLKRAADLARTAADATKVMPRRKAPMQRLLDIIIGTHPVLRSRVLYGLQPIIIYLAWCAVHVYSVYAGYITAGQAKFIIAHNIIGMVAFYPWVRSGYSARFQDSGLILPQIMWAASAVIIFYTFNAPLRAALMQVLCFIHLFGMFTLRPRQLVVVGGATIGMLLIMLGVMTYLRPANFEVGKETLNILFTSFIIGLITWMSILHSRARGRLSERKKEMAAAVDQVNELITRDSLTGLYNRKHIQELIERERKRQSLTGQPFCVALIDLDHFKHINDTYGHNIGDEVLCSFAKAAELTIRDTDTIARWGGEEFLVLMPDTTMEPDAQVAIDRVRNIIAASSPSPSVPALRLSFSAGLAAHIDGQTIEQSIARADHALYAAKHAGRSRTILATSGPPVPEPASDNMLDTDRPKQVDL